MAQSAFDAFAKTRSNVIARVSVPMTNKANSVISNFSKNIVFRDKDVVPLYRSAGLIFFIREKRERERDIQ